MWEHEQLVVRTGKRSGMTTMVALHSTEAGPAVGGCRMKPYERITDAVTDVLRLSKAMTLKCAAAGIPHGGAKSVIVVDRELTPQLRRAVLLDHADLINEFGGAYQAGPDVGTGPDDMLVLREVTPHAYCLPEEHGGTGSSSGPTARGVLAALKAASRHVFGTPDLTGRKVVISGFGSVGELIAKGLDGADITVSDVDESRRTGEYGWVHPDEAYKIKADVLIPAAVGGVLSPETVRHLDVKLIVGPANNQLTDDDVADLLDERGIVWVPDHVASAGGVIYTLAREDDGADHETALKRVDGIEATVERMLQAQG
ncbi:Glu/Leu/Phe/Val dehydrogenase dimerization domain-containing protein [Lentzea sp. BCCO 10_0061]|uniref:Glu/Leu/Phe/Val dehydrogenase dimerization domain-containing protein n=1 Tax=Lentzea sokolovensis TaxID=3095429 RepID=A0ABU4VBE8_9PSEU|nr:Glu/Leu/Phe/Val dehydrogenase dimerization domain-containing protein [Lentzea sp. BCCO 10_0061]MDX8148276.1 Glu/Leu/Phe/Val dehydrogenase dimerization domain-containing protein [Lentzea sp. BCCO 10_0061]